LEPAALPVFRVAPGGGAVDRKSDFVDPRVRETPRLLFAEGETVRAGVEVDVREVRLDVFAHLDGALVEEGFAVVEEVDARQRRSDFVHDAAEQIEVEHARLARSRDPRFRGAARLIARNVACGG